MWKHCETVHTQTKATKFAKLNFCKLLVMKEPWEHINHANFNIFRHVSSFLCFVCSHPRAEYIIRNYHKAQIGRMTVTQGEGLLMVHLPYFCLSVSVSSSPLCCRFAEQVPASCWWHGLTEPEPGPPAPPCLEKTHPCATQKTTWAFHNGWIWERAYVKYVVKTHHCVCYYERACLLTISGPESNHGGNIWLQ